MLAGVVSFVLTSNMVALFQWQTMPNPGYMQPIDTDRTLNYGTLVINSVAVGITTAVCAAVAAVGGERLAQ